MLLPRVVITMAVLLASASPLPLLMNVSIALRVNLRLFGLPVCLSASVVRMCLARCPWLLLALYVHTLHTSFVVLRTMVRLTFVVLLALPVCLSLCMLVTMTSGTVVEVSVVNTSPSCRAISLYQHNAVFCGR